MLITGGGRIAKTYLPATPPLFKLPAIRLKGPPSINEPGLREPGNAKKVPVTRVPFVYPTCAE